MKGHNVSERSSAFTPSHPCQTSELAAARTTLLDPNATRTRKPGARTVAPNDTLGQFSFAPATHTTVVTTTTTTTTRFPPLVIQGPRNVEHLDPLLYPLAKLRTPEPLKKVHFTVGDQTVVFQEADNAAITLNEVSWVGLFCYITIIS